MKKSRTQFYLAGTISVLVLTLIGLMWALSAGATHDTAVPGSITFTPAAVSFDNSVTTADRTITVTVTDSNLNQPVFVGAGPAGETATREPILVRVDEAILQGDAFRVRLDDGLEPDKDYTLLNMPGITGDSGVVTSGSTSDVLPIQARSHDGSAATVADIEIPSMGGLITATTPPTIDSDELSITTLLDAVNGRFRFTATQDLSSGDVFAISYTTSGRDLSRGLSTFTESIAVPNTGLITGESITHTFPVTLRGGGTGDIATVNSGDVTVSAGDVVITVGSTTTSSSISLTSITGDIPIGTGGGITLDYFGRETITSGTGDITTGGTSFTATLANLVQDSGVAGLTGDVTVVATTRTGGVTGDITATAVSGAVVTFTVATAVVGTITSADQYTVHYLGQDAVSVSSGLFSGEQFSLPLDINNLPLQGATGDISIAVTGRTAGDVPQKLLAGDASIVTGGLSLAGLANPASGLASGDQLVLVHSGDALPLTNSAGASTIIKVTYLGLLDLVNVKGSNNANIPLRLRETSSDSGVYTATVIAVGIAAGTGDSTGDHLEPSVTADRPQLIVERGDEIKITYKDQAPSQTLEVTVPVEADPPTFSNTSPASGDSTNLLDVLLTTDVADTIAGVNATVASTIGASPVKVVVTADGIAIAVTTGDYTIAETFVGSGVFTISYNINNIPDIATASGDGTDIRTELNWQISVEDNAGNVGFSGTSDLVVDNIAPDPATVTAFSGEGWDNTNKVITTSDRTSVRVDFGTAMDGTTFQTSDFQVAGVAPLAVASFTEEPNSAFLTVATLAPGATPKVELVAEVKDAGGNTISAATVDTATDNIAPALTLTIPSNFSTGDITLEAESDESILGILPTTSILRCVDSTISTLVLCTGSDIIPASAPTIVTPKLKWTFALSGVGSGGIRGHDKCPGRPGQQSSQQCFYPRDRYGAAIASEHDTGEFEDGRRTD